MSEINTTFCQNILQIVFGIILNVCGLFFTISLFVKYHKTKSTKDYSITYIIICCVMYLLALPTQVGLCINTKQNYENGLVNISKNASENVVITFLIINIVILIPRIPLFIILLVHKIKNDKLESPITFLKNIKLWILITTISVCVGVMAFSLYYSIKHVNDNTWKWVTYMSMFIGIISIPRFLPQSLTTIEKKETYAIPLIAFTAKLVGSIAEIGNSCILASSDGFSTFIAQILGNAFAIVSILIIVVIKIKNKDYLRDKDGNLKTKEISN